MLLCPSKYVNLLDQRGSKVEGLPVCFRSHHDGGTVVSTFTSQYSSCRSGVPVLEGRRRLVFWTRDPTFLGRSLFCLVGQKARLSVFQVRRHLSVSLIRPVNYLRTPQMRQENQKCSELDGWWPSVERRGSQTWKGSFELKSLPITFPQSLTAPLPDASDRH